MSCGEIFDERCFTNNHKCNGSLPNVVLGVGVGVGSWELGVGIWELGVGSCVENVCTYISIHEIYRITNV